MSRPPAPRVRVAPRAQAPAHHDGRESNGHADEQSRASAVAVVEDYSDDGGAHLDPSKFGHPTAAIDRADVDPEVAGPDASDVAEDFYLDGGAEVLDLTTQELELLAPGGTSEHRAARTLIRPALPDTIRRTAGSSTAVVEPDEAPKERLLLREIGRAVRAGLEAMVLSWLIVVVPVVAGYVATVAAPVLGESSWIDAARNGTAVWLLGLGQGLDIMAPGDVASTETAVAAPVLTGTVTIVPLALTLLTGWLLAGSVRRARIGSLPGLGAVLATAVAIIAGAHAFARTTPSAMGVLTALGVLTTALVVGWTRGGLAPALPDRPALGWVRSGLRAGRATLVLLLGTGLVLVVVVTALNLGQVVEIQRALDPDRMSGFLMVLAQLALLPTFAVWALAWLVGPGFAIGAVTVTPLAASTGPLPVLPVLAAIPEAGPGPGAWVVLVPIAVTALALTGPLGRATQWRAQLTTAGVAVVLVVATGGVLAALSGGSVGPLSVVGTSGILVAGGLAWTTTLGAALALGVSWTLRFIGVDLSIPLADRVRRVLAWRPRRRAG